MRVGQLETQLYDACMGFDHETSEADDTNDKTEPTGGAAEAQQDKEAGQRGENEGLYSMMLQLCSELHKHLRPRVYHGTDMDTLCEVSYIHR